MLVCKEDLSNSLSDGNICIPDCKTVQNMILANLLETKTKIFFYFISMFQLGRDGLQVEE
jgi:hypothetical protein